jgi:hypothetical protein
MKFITSFLLSAIAAITTSDCTIAQSMIQTNTQASKSHSNAASPKYRTRAFIILPQKKNGSGMQVAYRLESKPMKGQALTISLRFDHVNHPDGGSVDFSTDKELEIRSPAIRQVISAKRTALHQLVVTPQAEGLFYVNVFTEQAGRKSAAAIPVRVGQSSVVLNTLGPISADHRGEKVIAIPAE